MPVGHSRGGVMDAAATAARVRIGVDAGQATELVGAAHPFRDCLERARASHGGRSTGGRGGAKGGQGATPCRPGPPPRPGGWGGGAPPGGGGPGLVGAGHSFPGCLERGGGEHGGRSTGGGGGAYGGQGDTSCRPWPPPRPGCWWRAARSASARSRRDGGGVAVCS